MLMTNLNLNWANLVKEYNTADARLKNDLPPLISAAFSMLPHLLAAQIMTQNTLLGQYYTILHNYCQDEHFPSPPPPMNEVIATWDADFQPLKRELESINCISSGKAVRQPMKMEDQISGSTVTGLNIRNGYAQRRASHQAPPKPSASPQMIAFTGPPSPELSSKPRPGGASPSSSSALLSPPVQSNTFSPSPNDFHTPGAHSPAAPRADYFSRDRLPSNASMTSSMTSVAAGKKKPPPPPTKRSPSTQGLYVTALYDFDGEKDTDLSFREGDKIRVTKKTASSEDWWKGELRGIEGSFPANYCQIV